MQPVYKNSEYYSPLITTEHPDMYLTSSPTVSEKFVYIKTESTGVIPERSASYHWDCPSTVLHPILTSSMGRSWSCGNEHERMPIKNGVGEHTISII